MKKEILKPPSNAARLSRNSGRISREEEIMCQRNMLTAQEGTKWDRVTSEVRGRGDACWIAENTSNQITVSDLATLLTSSGRLGSQRA